MSNTNDEVVTPSQLYRYLADYLGMVRWGGKSFTIRKRNESLARLIPVEQILPGKDGRRRFPRPEYRHEPISPRQLRSQIKPRRLRSHMSECLYRVRFGNQRLRIESRGKIVAILVPPDDK